MSGGAKSSCAAARRLALIATSLLPACSEKSDSGECEPRYATSEEDEALVADEAWRAIADAEDRVEVGGANAPILIIPEEDQAFSSAGTPPIFTWELPAMAIRTRSPRGSRFAALIRRVGRWIEPIGMAWAHGSPTTGDVFVAVILGTPDSGCPLSFVTTGTDWALSAAEWRALTKSSGTFDLRLTHAYLTENVILEGDGPFRPSADRRFSVEP